MPNLPFLYPSQVCSSYVLTIVGADLYGAPGGLTGTGTVIVNLIDVNDNVPTLTQEQVKKHMRMYCTST